MALNSVNTNGQAMIALQNLNATGTDLAVSQNRISTGRKVDSAKDNGSTWAIAQSMRANSKSLDAVRDSLHRGQSTIDVAMAAAGSISDLLLQMKAKALAASDTTLDTASRESLNVDFKALRDQISKTVDNADFNGSNMIKTGGASIQALANASGTNKLTVLAQSLALGSTNLTGIGSTASLFAASAGTAQAMIATVNTAIGKVSTALAKLGTGSKALDMHLTFINKLQDSIDNGIGNLVDADLAKESAKIQSLQTRQQLGVQALAIANSSTQMMLSLFK
ncbi:MAG: flagellin [Caulobacteraceae bacterium]|nr:flagellin [Caulobacteraceae bacterium]